MMIVNKEIISRNKVAFYPCCAGDFIQPRKILAEYVDEIIFCDIRKNEKWHQVPNKDESPKVTLIIEDVRKYVKRLPTIDVLFYRNDGRGEGGSHININGPWGVDNIAKRFSKHGGIIITDGSNDYGHIYKKMHRPDGYTRSKIGLHFKLSDNQHLLDQYGLHTIEVNHQSV